MTEPVPQLPEDDPWFLHNYIDKPNKPSKRDLEELREYHKRFQARLDAATAARRKQPKA